MSAKTIVRGVVAMALVPCLWFGGASARYVMATRAADRTVVRTMQLDFPRPTASQRFLIVSPHPDDETLACGGLIQQAVRAGASVRVVFLTSGDGYRMAIEREYRNLALRPDDYVRFGALRRREARNAASALGLSPRRLRFLGMPDGALTDLWRTNWAETARLRSEALATDRAPYAWVVQPGAPFCGAVLLGNIEDQMDRFRPTDLLVPHPADDHGDHAASAAFVQLALARLRRGSSPWARACKLHYYLVHRGDWPQPQGKRLNEAMAPPAEMTGLDTEWRGLSLSPEEVRVKAEAIGAYRSQTSVMRRFLMSFARTNEFYGAITDACVAQAEGTPRQDAAGLRAALIPIALDAVDDNLIRRYQSDADIRAVEAVRAQADLLLRVQTVQTPRRTSQTRVFARFAGDPSLGQSGGLLALRAQGARVTGSPGVRRLSDTTGVTMVVPLRDLGYARSAVIEVETTVANVVVDRTGPRMIHIRYGR